MLFARCCCIGVAKALQEAEAGGHGVGAGVSKEQLKDMQQEVQQGYCIS